ncbi:MAG: hypothetical protein Q9182_007589 [Xanthomendoza sp. 2 TL-2023]
MANQVEDVMGGEYDDRHMQEDDESDGTHIQDDYKGDEVENAVQSAGQSAGQPKKKRMRKSTTAQQKDDVQEGLLWVANEISQVRQTYNSVANFGTSSAPSSANNASPSPAPVTAPVATGPTPPSDKKIIELGQQSLKHATRHEMAPMVGDVRGRMKSAYMYILDRNMKEHFWPDQKVKVMVGGKDVETFRRAREQSDLFDAHGNPRKRDIQQLMDRHDHLGRFAKTKGTSEGQQISQKSKELSIYSEILKRQNEKTMKKLTGARQSVVDLTEKNLELKVKTQAGASYLSKMFHSEHRDLYHDLAQTRAKLSDFEQKNSQLMALMDSYPDTPAIEILPVMNRLWYEHSPLAPTSLWIPCRVPSPAVEPALLAQYPIQTPELPSQNFLGHMHDFPERQTMSRAEEQQIIQQMLPMVRLLDLPDQTTLSLPNSPPPAKYEENDEDEDVADMAVTTKFAFEEVFHA